MASTDITWSDMTAAGIDTDKVRRQPNNLGGSEYVYETDTVKVAFGPAVDMSDGTTLGWDICTYDREDDDWNPTSQHWVETPADALAIVAPYTK